MQVESSKVIERLRILVEINSLINSSYSDVDALLVFILESAMRLVHCESSSLLLLDRDSSSLRFVVALGPKGAEAKNILVNRNSIAGWVVENNQSLIVNDVLADPRFFRSVQDATGYVTKNILAIPLRIKGNCVGVIELLNKNGLQPFNEDDLEFLELLSNQAGIAYSNADEFRAAQDSISVLSSTVENGREYHPFVAKSPEISKVLDIVRNVAKSDATILLTGESGVGKELFAEQIHLNSSRRNGAFVRVNCAALSPQLLESELFGHVKGAFTDAVSDVMGRFEKADGGTLFLDEIGEIPLNLQAKLLRVLQEQKFERVGSSETVSVDVRIIVATNRDLERLVEEGSFRKDLYYRLNVVPICIPSLRNRRADIEPLARFFLKRFSLETKKNFRDFDVDSLRCLLSYDWPGNVRELENIIERACVLGGPPYIRVEDLAIKSVPAEKPCPCPEEMEISGDDADRTLKTAVTNFKRFYLKKILQEVGGNQTKACKILGLQRTYVSRLISELDIR